MSRWRRQQKKRARFAVAAAAYAAELQLLCWVAEVRTREAYPGCRIDSVRRTGRDRVVIRATQLGALQTVAIKGVLEL